MENETNSRQECIIGDVEFRHATVNRDGELTAVHITLHDDGHKELMREALGERFPVGRHMVTPETLEVLAEAEKVDHPRFAGGCRAALVLARAVETKANTRGPCDAFRDAVRRLNGLEQSARPAASAVSHSNEAAGQRAHLSGAS